MTQASAPKPELDKVIILMTDGDNTRNRWTASPPASTIDERTKTACANAKAAGVKLYTVRVMEGNEALLKACASDPTMYFNVQNASQLSEIFSKIASDLAKLRIAK